jgi:dynein heavy chain
LNLSKISSFPGLIFNATFLLVPTPCLQAAGAGETQEALYAFWLERVRTNLHVILCLSPVGEAFRERCRMFPGLVNCTTIDW